MKKVCFVIPSLTAGGGAERVITELANYSADFTKIETHLIILAKVERFYSISPNVTIHEPEFDYKKYSRIVFTIKLMRYLRRTVKEVKPDAVLSFEEMYSSFVLLATLFLKYHIFVSDRSKPTKDWGAFHNLLRKIIYRFAHGIISQTEFSKEFLFKETGNKNIKVIGNPIRKHKLDIGGIKKENIILNVGRLIKSKKHDLLMEIFSKTDYRGWKLYIVGDGPEKENLIQYRDTLGLQKFVVFTGNIANVDEYYLKSKIFAFTSVSEGFPNALGEAMAARLACISFDCEAGPADLIQNGINGYLVNEGDLDDYLKKLNTLMHDDALQTRFGDSAKEKAETLSIDKIGPKYLNFLLK